MTLLLAWMLCYGFGWPWWMYALSAGLWGATRFYNMVREMLG